MIRRAPASFLFAVAAALGSAACSSSEGGGTQGSGGQNGSGGAVSSGGATGTGGAATGGSHASGGQTGSGGSGTGGSATGGSGAGGGSGSGGATSTGGSAGAGQTGGHGGAGGGATGGAGAAGGHAGSGVGSGGSGGAGAYNPCPTNGDPCKILPLGDSITHGFGSADDAGYRTQLFKLIVAASQKVTFTGSLMNGPGPTMPVSGQTFPRNHEGHDGWTIDPGYSSYGYSGISSLIPNPALDGNPHIILLHIGTNDANASMGTATMSTRLEALLDKIAQASPSSLIVVAQITPLGYSSAALTAYNSKIPGVVQAHAAKGQHVGGVDMSKMPVPADIASDNVHPNDQGYAYMASIWYPAIKNLLPK